jgi:sec-independent protein translocase protein TatA
MLEGLLQPTHLLLILGIALLVLGPKKLPDLGKGLGESIRGFKLAMAAKKGDPPQKPPSARIKPSAGPSKNECPGWTPGSGAESAFRC